MVLIMFLELPTFLDFYRRKERIFFTFTKPINFILLLEESLFIKASLIIGIEVLRVMLLMQINVFMISVNNKLDNIKLYSKVRDFCRKNAMAL